MNVRAMKGCMKIICFLLGKIKNADRKRSSEFFALRKVELVEVDTVKTEFMRNRILFDQMK